MQTLVPIAANGGKDPEVIDAAACTFLHEGRIADLRCTEHIALLLCGGGTLTNNRNSMRLSKITGDRYSG